MTHRDDYFFAGGGRQEALDALFDGVYHAGVVMLLVGSAGSGRTAIVSRFVAEVDPQVLSVAVVAGDILMSADQLFAGLCAQLDVQVQTDPYETLWRAIGDLRALERSPVLVVDDAHDLGVEARAAVVRFARDTDVALVLVGDETLAPGMDPDVAFEVIPLRALSEEESEAFIAGWLDIADEDELPSHRVVARLHRHSAGLPGRLAGLLGSGAAQRAPLLPSGVPPWHAVVALLAIVFLLASLAFIVMTPAADEAEGPVEVSVPLPGPAESMNAVAGANKRAVSAVVPQPLDVRPFVSARVEDAGDVGTTGVDGGNNAPTPVEQAAPLPASPAPVSTPSPAVVPGARLTAAPVAVPVAGAVAPTVRFSADELALMTEPRTRYTVQLFASFNEAAVQQFRQRHAGTEMRVFRTLREDLPWYVAVSGSYRNRDEARASIARLPLDLQALKPWARSLQGIQDELRRRKE